MQSGSQNRKGRKLTADENSVMEMYAKDKIIKASKELVDKGNLEAYVSDLSFITQVFLLSHEDEKLDSDLISTITSVLSVMSHIATISDHVSDLNSIPHV